MSFNVSRFLVRVRQFWTRNRLVPVLGVTALLLFGITSYQAIASMFKQEPVVAGHFFFQGTDGETFIRGNGDTHVFHFRLDQDKRWHHRHEEHRHRFERLDAERILLEKRIENEHRAHELRERAEKLRAMTKRLELEKEVIKLQDDDDKVIIMNKDNDETFEITINGKKISVVKSGEEI